MWLTFLYPSLHDKHNPTALLAALHSAHLALISLLHSTLGIVVGIVVGMVVGMVIVIIVGIMVGIIVRIVVGIIFLQVELYYFLNSSLLYKLNIFDYLQGGIIYIGFTSFIIMRNTKAII